MALTESTKENFGDCSDVLARRRARSAWLLIAPMLVVLSLVALWPLVRTIAFSFTDASLADSGGGNFIGFRNYIAYSNGVWSGILVDGDWWRSVSNTLIFTVVSVSLETIIGMVVALILNQDFRGRGLVRAAVLIPWATPTVVSAKLWAWLLNDQYGLINDLLMKIGLIEVPLAWTADPDLVMLTIIMVDVWKAVPFMALLLLAALQLVPKDCLEAARVDGVSRLRVFFSVILPMIWAPLTVAVIFRTLDALRVFDVVYVMTSNNVNTMTMSIYARQNLVDFLDVGYGSAVSTCLVLIILIFTMVYIRVSGLRLGKGD